MTSMHDAADETCWLLGYGIDTWGQKEAAVIAVLSAWGGTWLAAGRARAGGISHVHGGADIYNAQKSFKRRLPKITQSFTITEKAPTRAFSLLKVLSHLRHF